MRFNVNVQVILSGFVILLVGLGFHAWKPIELSLLVNPLTGVGAAIMGAGMTSWLVTRHFSGVNVVGIVQALSESATFTRKDHTLELVFSLSGTDAVTVGGEHAFTLVNHSSRRAVKKFNIYTDLGSWNKRGGFESVMEPTGNVLEDAALEGCIMEQSGKTYFSKSYNLNSMSTASFRFNTFGNYRRVDRLIWTVQDLSSDFSVRIVNNTGIKKPFVVKVNHHREKDILEGLKTLSRNDDHQEVMILDFNCDVLPYQGFEVMWNLDD